MKIRSFAFAALLASLTPAFASTVGCPDLAAAKMTGSCPSEDELLFTFNGYCSDNARIYGKGAEVCTSYQKYRQLKNIVLWESGDGAFQAYVSCDLPADAVKAKKASAVAVSKDGKMTRLACGYGDGVTFTYRTHEQCRVDGAAACKADAAACQASCE
jgi:hypothetical protein